VEWVTISQATAAAAVGRDGRWIEEKRIGGFMIVYSSISRWMYEYSGADLLLLRLVNYNWKEQRRWR